MLACEVLFNKLNTCLDFSAFGDFVFFPWFSAVEGTRETQTTAIGREGSERFPELNRVFSPTQGRIGKFAYQKAKRASSPTSFVVWR